MLLNPGWTTVDTCSQPRTGLFPCSGTPRVMMTLIRMNMIVYPHGWATSPNQLFTTQLEERPHGLREECPLKHETRAPSVPGARADGQRSASAQPWH